MITDISEPRAGRAATIIDRVDAALTTLSDTRPSRSVLSSIVEERYAVIAALRRRGDSWDAIGKALNAHGVCFTSEAIRRAVHRYEKEHFGKGVTTGTAARKRYPNSLRAIKPASTL